MQQDTWGMCLLSSHITKERKLVKGMFLNKMPRWDNILRLDSLAKEKNINQMEADLDWTVWTLSKITS